MIIRYDHIPRPVERHDALANDRIEAAVQRVLVAMASRKAGRLARRDAASPSDALASLAAIKSAAVELLKLISASEAEFTAAEAAAAAAAATPAPKNDPEIFLDARDARRTAGASADPYQAMCARIEAESRALGTPTAPAADAPTDPRDRMAWMRERQAAAARARGR
jgi:hypothetical protein